MAFESLRGYIQLASGLTELSRAKAMEAAKAVLTLPATITTGAVPEHIQALAEELLAAAAANRESLVALIRSEVESAITRTIVTPIAELERARAALTKLSADVEELRSQVFSTSAMRTVTGSGVAAIGVLSGRSARDEPGYVMPGFEVFPEAEAAATQTPAATEKVATRKVATRKAGTTKASTSKVATRKSAAKSTAPKKTATQKTATQKTAAKKASTTKTALSAAGATDAAAKKTAAKKTAGPKSAARKTAAQKSSATKAAATTPSPRKSASRAGAKASPPRTPSAKRGAAASPSAADAAGSDT